MSTDNVINLGRCTTIKEIVDTLNADLKDLDQIAVVYKFRGDRTVYGAWCTMDTSDLALMALYLQHQVMKAAVE